MSEFNWKEFENTNFSEFERFFRDSNIQPIYDTRSDYTTNAPSFYEYLARHNHLIKILAKRIYDYDKILAKQFDDWVNEFNSIFDDWENEINNRFTEWDNLIKKFPENVENLLIDWLENGVINDLIINNVFPEFDERIKKLEKKDITNLLDYQHLVVDNNWGDAIHTALRDSDSLYIPKGEYTTYPIEITESNKEIYGDGLSTILKFVADGKIANGIIANGTLGNIHRVTKNVIPYDSYIEIENSNLFNKYDDIIIKSQKNALSYEDNKDDTLLGKPTGSQVVPFGEFKKVSEVGTNNITVHTNLIYHSYESSNVNEVNPAQDFSTVQKVNFLENITIRDLTINHLHTGNLMYFRICKNVTIDNIYFNHTNYNGKQTSLVTLNTCLNCEVRNSTYNVDIEKSLLAEQMYSLNVFKITNSQSCGFKNCNAYNATQPFDISYFTGSIPSSNCYIEGCNVYDPSQTGITTHGGNYLTRISNNNIYNAKQGISHRGRSGIITNNVINGKSFNRSTTSVYQAGVSLYEGGACQNIVANNTISNFFSGVSQIDSGSDGGRIGYSGNQIISNTFSKFRYGIYIHKAIHDDLLTKMFGILVNGNTFKLENWRELPVYAMSTTPFCNGITFINNIVKGIESEGSGSGYKRLDNFYGLHVGEKSSNIKFMNNTLMDIDYGFYHNGDYPDGSTKQEQYKDIKVYAKHLNNEYYKVRIPTHYQRGVEDYPTEVFH